jgi:hypothetical protein
MNGGDIFHALRQLAVLLGMAILPCHFELTQTQARVAASSFLRKCRRREVLGKQVEDQ